MALRSIYPNHTQTHFKHIFSHKILKKCLQKQNQHKKNPKTQQKQYVVSCAWEETKKEIQTNLQKTMWEVARSRQPRMTMHKYERKLYFIRLIPEIS